MLQFKLLLAISLLACSNAQYRIVGGITSDISRSPYMVALHYEGYYFCAGAIVTEYHVVTAAHCVHGRLASEIVLVAGITTLTERGQRRDVDIIWYPSVYSPKTMEMDIAVIRVQTPFILGGIVQKIPLCTTPLTIDMPVRIQGWGKVHERSEVPSNELRMVTVPLIARSTCAARYAGLGIKLQTSMVCAGVGVRDSCTGDSGGPGVINNEICGVVSFGLGCARPGYPGIYTNINHVRVRRFLEEALKR